MADDSDDSSYNDDDSTDNDCDDQSQSGSQIEDEVEHKFGNEKITTMFLPILR